MNVFHIFKLSVNKMGGSELMTLSTRDEHGMIFAGVSNRSF